jgi:hypothetical protein
LLNSCFASKAGEDETGCSRQAHANFILDNLLAAGKAEPMIVPQARRRRKHRWFT